MFDKDLHKFYVYAKFLMRVLPLGQVSKVDVDDKVLLDYYRIEKDFEGNIELEETDSPLTPISGGGGSKEEKKDSLAALIDKINKRFGTEFTNMDKVMQQIKQDFSEDQEARDFVKNNKASMFDHIYNKKFMDIFIKRYQQNDEFFKVAMENEDMMTMIMETMKNEIYSILKEAK